MAEDKYKCTNVKFNMDNPEQAKGWHLLTSHKGKKSYAEVISWALIKACEQSDTTNRLDDYQISGMSFNAADIARQVVSQLKDEQLVVSAQVNASSISSENIPAEKEQEYIGGDEKVSENEKFNSKPTKDMLGFAFD